MQVDAGCFSDDVTCWGCVVQNQDGETIMSACHKDNISIEPLLAEALGVCWGLQLAVAKQWRKVKIYTDAQTVAQCFDRKIVVATINHVILDCKELIRNLNVVKVEYISRMLKTKKSC
jgi:ribonuclease HI